MEVREPGGVHGSAGGAEDEAMSSEHQIPPEERKQVIGVTEDGRVFPLGVTQSIRQGDEPGEVVVTLSMAFPSVDQP